MLIIELFVKSLLWLSIALYPTLLCAGIGAVLSLYLTGELTGVILPVCTAIGFILGSHWAETVRKGVGLSEYLGRLVSSQNDAKGKSK